LQVTENTKKRLGPRLAAFGGFASEPVEAPSGRSEPLAPKTTNGAHASEASPHGATSRERDPIDAVSVREVLAFPASMLGKVPAPWALHLDVDGDACVVTTSRACYGEARDAGVPVLLGGEWFALAHAAQNDRAWRRELREWIERKRVAAEWRLTHDRAFAGMPIANADDLVWNVGEVLERVEATLVRVEVRT